MKNIVFFQYPWRLWRNRLRGVYRYAEKADWRVQVVEYGRTALTVRKAVQFWRPDGCIVEGGYTELPNFRLRDYASVPSVFCDANVRRMKGPFNGVMHDSVQTAMLAVRELLGLGFGDYAFVGSIQPREWSVRRQGVMRGMVERSGRRFHVFSPDRPGDMGAFFDRIRAWLRQLPRPCGVFGANDTMADLVLQACRMELLRVPDDIAVIGVDNDELLCEHCVPTLTSVTPDFEHSGYAAAALLDCVMRNPAAPPKQIRFGAAHIVRRNSTVRFKRRDDAILNAVEHIRQNACSGLSAADVCALIGGSRRQAEYRFVKLVGRTIAAQIQSVRIARAKDLLIRRGIPLEQIYAECGYATAASLRKAFKRATGVSLRAWRSSQQGGGIVNTAR